MPVTSSKRSIQLMERRHLINLARTTPLLLVQILTPELLLKRTDGANSHHLVTRDYFGGRVTCRPQFRRNFRNVVARLYSTVPRARPRTPRNKPVPTHPGRYRAI